MVAADKSFTPSSSAGGPVTVPASSQKRLDDSAAARFTTANFQEVAPHPGGPKDGPLAPETKKKNHPASQRARKPLPPAKPLPSTVVPMATSSTAPSSSSTGPFHQGLLTSSTKTTSSDFLSFSESSLRSGGGDTFSPPPFSRVLVKEGGVASDSKPAHASFSSLLSLPSPAPTGGKLYDSSLSSGDTPLSAPSALLAGYKRPLPSPSAAPPVGVGGAEEGLKGKKRRGNWRNRYGPCYSNSDRKTEEGAEPHTPAPLAPPTSASPAPPSSSGSAPSSRVGPGGGGPGGGGRGGGGRGGGGLGGGATPGVQKSSLLRNGAVQSHSGASGGPGSFSSGDGSLGTVAMGGANADTSQLQQATPSLAPPPTPFAANTPLSSPASAHTGLPGLQGSVFNLAPSHMFGNRLNPNSAMAALIAQSEASPADQEMGDCSSSVQGFPVRASPKTTPRSPIGGLQIRYDPSGSLPGLGLPGVGGSGGEVPLPLATSIEQLLERQWSEGQNFLLQHGAQSDVLALLRSLHQLQEENRRLEQHIQTLSLKKERLQLLSAQLAVPFTACPGPDVKRDLSSAQDSVSCSHSSSGSASSLSTPPSLSQSPPQPLVNGGPPGGAPGLGAPALAALGGGALNGVIQISSGPLTHTSTQGPSLSLPGNNSRSAPSKGSTARLDLFSEQQKLLFHQNLLSTQPSADQQQLLFYQLMQQQQDLHQLQSLSSTQLTSISLSSSSSSQPPRPSNPFLALHTHTNPDTLVAGQKACLADKALGAGQEKT